MKVITIHQPWASLIVLGHKRIETRSWNTSYRGPLAIHASKKVTREQIELTQTQPFLDLLKQYDELPTGAIIGAVNLTNSFHSEHADPWIADAWKPNVEAMGPLAEGEARDQLRGLMARERRFGNYSNGMMGWVLENPVHFKYPTKVSGSQGFWEYPICKSCGCTQHDCRVCIERTGHPCSWVEDDLCSACYHKPQIPKI